MIVSTEAVVLKSMRYRETSKIVTLYTRRYGKLKVIAKGARQPKSKFGGLLEPITHVTAIFYRRENRDLHTLSQVDLQNGFFRIHADLDKLAAGLAVLDLANVVFHDEEENAPAFGLLTETLRVLDAAAAGPRPILLAFEVRLAALLGFQPQFRSCGVCGRDLPSNGPEEAVMFDVAGGGFLCDRCEQKRTKKLKVSRRAQTTLQALMTHPLDRVANLSLGSDLERELGELLSSYLRFHVGHRSLFGSDAVLSKLVH